ncbi:MAG: hypothetical protein ACRDHG_04090 [Anaerolineales bacterium]
MFALGLRQLQQALDQKANQIQHEFIVASEQLEEVGRKLLEAVPEDRERLQQQQRTIRASQQTLADDVNTWRDRARGVRSQPGADSLRTYLNELRTLDDPLLNPAIQHALYLLDAPEEELAKLAEQQAPTAINTPAGRLIQRSRTEYDLRGADAVARQRAAVEFANRPGLAQQDDVIAEIEAAIEDPDPLVRETALLTMIQLHRFRCMRSADLDQAHASVQKLASLNHLTAIPSLIEILEKPRTGFVQTDDGTEEADNNRSRMVALLRLIEWHTPEAKMAVHKLQFDRDPNLVKTSRRALELFPDEWNGPLKVTGPLPGFDEGQAGTPS